MLLVGHSVRMHVIEFDRDSAAVRLSADELSLINNALNEVSNGVRDLDDDSEFSTRLGASREDARALLAQVHELIDRGRDLSG